MSKNDNSMNTCLASDNGLTFRSRMPRVPLGSLKKQSLQYDEDIYGNVQMVYTIRLNRLKFLFLNKILIRSLHFN